jgi:hypothetical protein
MEAAGLHPIDMQGWALMVAVFMLAIALPGSYGDYVLSRRQLRTLGTILSIDYRGDSPTPRIGFRDTQGRSVEFDSNLPLNSVTDTVGSTLEIVYDPLQRAREAGRRLLKSLGAFVWYGGAIASFAYAVWGGSLAAG